MFYKMIAHKRDEWYQSDECTINDLMTSKYLRKRCMVIYGIKKNI